MMSANTSSLASTGDTSSLFASDGSYTNLAGYNPAERPLWATMIENARQRDQLGQNIDNMVQQMEDRRREAEAKKAMEASNPSALEGAVPKDPAGFPPQDAALQNPGASPLPNAAAPNAGPLSDQFTPSGTPQAGSGIAPAAPADTFLPASGQIQPAGQFAQPGFPMPAPDTFMPSAMPLGTSPLSPQAAISPETGQFPDIYTPSGASGFSMPGGLTPPAGINPLPLPPQPGVAMGYPAGVPQPTVAMPAQPLPPFSPTSQPPSGFPLLPPLPPIQAPPAMPSFPYPLRS